MSVGLGKANPDAFKRVRCVGGEGSEKTVPQGEENAVVRLLVGDWIGVVEAMQVG